MKEFDPTSKFKFHPLVSYDGILLAKVPGINTGPKLQFPIMDPDTQQIQVVSTPHDITIPIIPVYVYESNEVQLITETLLVMMLLRSNKDFLTHDFVATPTVGSYVIKATHASFNSSWQIPPDKEMVEYIIEKRKNGRS